MTKVCHMTSVHPPYDIRIFHKECVSLARAGYDVTLIQPGTDEERSGVRIFGIGTLPGGRLRRMLEGPKRVYRRALEADADIYQFHDPELLLCGLKLKRAGKRVVFDSHEKYTMQLRTKPYLPRPVAALVAEAYGIVEKYILHRIDGLIFPCTLAGKHPFAGQCQRVITLNNVPMLCELYDRYVPEAKNRFVACYIGYVRPDRGNTENVLACNEANIPLILAGAFDSAEYEEQLRKLDKKRLTEILGRVDRTQVLAVLRRSSVGLVTERNVGQNNVFDNLPTKAYEYMSMGLPVIISHSDYVDGLLKKYDFGIAVDPADVGETVRALRFLAENPAEARRMGENGRRAIREEFNWERESRKLVALYEDILKE